MKEYITSQIIDKKGYITGHAYHGELIRCKDCKHFRVDHYDNGAVEHMFASWTEMWCNRMYQDDCGESLDINEDDFCSWAERKEE